MLLCIVNLLDMFPLPYTLYLMFLFYFLVLVCCPRFFSLHNSVDLLWISYLSTFLCPPYVLTCPLLSTYFSKSFFCSCMYCTLIFSYSCSTSSHRFFLEFFIFSFLTLYLFKLDKLYSKCSISPLI